MLENIPEDERDGTTWHQLATIDLNEANYAAARVNFAKSLVMRQAIGDKAGEAATWHQLGLVAWETDRPIDAVQLVAISILLLNATGSGEKDQVTKNLSGMCGQLDYSEEQLNELIRAVTASYQQDRGVAILKAAFPVVP